MNLEIAWPWLLTALTLPLLIAWLLPRAPEQPGSTLRVRFSLRLPPPASIRPGVPRTNCG